MTKVHWTVCTVESPVSNHPKCLPTCSSSLTRGSCLQELRPYNWFKLLPHYHILCNCRDSVFCKYALCMQKVDFNQKGLYFSLTIWYCCVIPYPIYALISLKQWLQDAKNKRKVQTFVAVACRRLQVPNTVVWDKWVKMVNFRLYNEMRKVNWSTWAKHGLTMTLTVLILHVHAVVVCKMPVPYRCMNSAKIMTLLSMSFQWIDRAPTWCSGGHAFDFCQGITCRFFSLCQACVMLINPPFTFSLLSLKIYQFYSLTCIATHNDFDSADARCLSHLNSVKWPCYAWILIAQWIKCPGVH